MSGLGHSRLNRDVRGVSGLWTLSDVPVGRKVEVAFRNEKSGVQASSR
jgi:hypothetical protein